MNALYSITEQTLIGCVVSFTFAGVSGDGGAAGSRLSVARFAGAAVGRRSATGVKIRSST